MVGFFGGVGYFGAGFFGGVVQVMGFVWHRSSGLWCGDCCPTWWKSGWSCGGRGKLVWNCVYGSIIGFDGSSLMVFFLVFWYIWGVMIWFGGFFFFFFNMVLLLV